MMSIKKLMMAAVMLASSIGASAQDREGTWTITPKLGPTISFLSTLPDLPVSGMLDLKKTHHLGLQVGAEVEYGVTDMVGIAAGLNYAMQGGRWRDYSNPMYSITGTRFELGYITLPVVCNVYLADVFAVKAGVQLGYLTNARLKSNIALKGEGLESFNESSLSDFNRFDVSIPVGFSVDLSDNLVIDARYNWGLTKVNKESEPGESDIRNSVFVITFGYKIPLNL